MWAQMENKRSDEDRNLSEWISMTVADALT
jgi:hypothetical protein